MAGCTTVCAFTEWWTFGPCPVRGCYDLFCCEPSCTSLRVHMCFPCKIFKTKQELTRLLKGCKAEGKIPGRGIVRTHGQKMKAPGVRGDAAAQCYREGKTTTAPSFPLPSWGPCLPGASRSPRGDVMGGGRRARSGPGDTVARPSSSLHPRGTAAHQCLSGAPGNLGEM